MNKIQYHYFMIEKTLLLMNSTPWWRIWRHFILNIELVHHADRFQLYLLLEKIKDEHHETNQISFNYSHS